MVVNFVALVLHLLMANSMALGLRLLMVINAIFEVLYFD
jgi:hypothetical protein